jgi:Transglycosylase SLT domain
MAMVNGGAATIDWRNPGNGLGQLASQGMLIPVISTWTSPLPNYWSTNQPPYGPTDPYSFSYVSGYRFAQGPGDPVVDRSRLITSTINQKYDECAKGVNAVPDQDATARILLTNFLEGVDPTLLGATWALEGGLNQTMPMSNGNGYNVKGKDGKVTVAYPKNGADVGPMQINYKTWHAWEPVASLGDGVFGGTTTGSEPFNGDPTTNLRAGARILNDLMKATGGDRSKAAGLYRVGQGYDKKRPKEKPSALQGRLDRYKDRVGNYNALEAGYDKFFNCLGLTRR